MTDNNTSDTTDALPPPPPPTVAVELPKPWYKRPVPLIGVSVLALGVAGSIGAAIGGSSADKQAGPAATTVSVETTVATTTVYDWAQKHKAELLAVTDQIISNAAMIDLYSDEFDLVSMMRVCREGVAYLSEAQNDPGYIDGPSEWRNIIKEFKLSYEDCGNADFESATVHTNRATVLMNEFAEQIGG